MKTIHHQKRAPSTTSPQEVSATTNAIFAKVEHVVTAPEWALHAPLIEEINRLKVEKNALILAHNYQAAEIYHGIADVTGDSLQLAQLAAEADADLIIICGVHFMAETAKLLNPTRTVLTPDPTAGCSLAESITGAQVRELKRQYPGVPVVTYVNTSAEVKAESDICCTSSNAVQIVESLGVDRVICLPDQYLAGYIAERTEVEVIDWKGECIVHEKFQVSDLRALREQYPGICIIAHPECTPQVQHEADMVGSTSGLMRYIDENRPSKVALITECTMSGNISVEFPEVDFIQPCSLCPYMRQITLQNVLEALLESKYTVEIPEDVAERARLSVTRMLEASAAAAAGAAARQT